LAAATTAAQNQLNELVARTATLVAQLEAHEANTALKTTTGTTGTTGAPGLGFRVRVRV